MCFSMVVLVLADVVMVCVCVFKDITLYYNAVISC